MDETFYQSFIETTNSTMKHLNAYKIGADANNSLNKQSRELKKVEDENFQEIDAYKNRFKELRKRFEKSKDKQHND